MEKNYPVYEHLRVTQKMVKETIAFPPQQQNQVPGLEWAMVPRPIYDYEGYQASWKLKGKVA